MPDSHRYAYCQSCSAVVRDFNGDAVWRDREGHITCDHEPPAPGQTFHAPRPDVSGILRERLVESLIADGVLSGDAEVVADDVISFARERGRAMREARAIPPGADADA